MAFEPKDMSGSLFVNDRKEQDNHPDRNGSCVINGVEFWISGWMKKTSEGKPWLSLAFKPKDAKPAERRLARQNRDEDLDPPF